MGESSVIGLSFLLLCATCAAATHRDDNVELVKDYIISHSNATFREPNGTLKYPYLVPAGPYDQCWDWDSVFTGVALLDLGSAPYLAGSMKNFFEQTDANGQVAICVDPSTTSPSCSSDPADNPQVKTHAKPLLIQGALIAAEFMDDFEQFREYRVQMEAQLNYWESERKDPSTGLYTWHDQMESGADNLPLSPCPTSRSVDCWDEDVNGNSLISADVVTYLYREHLAYASFLSSWGEEGGEEQKKHVEMAWGIASSLGGKLWSEESWSYKAWNTTSQQYILNDVYVMGVPLFGGSGLVEFERAEKLRERLFREDMLGEYGIRSTSSNDKAYNNYDLITPYSNWQGPVWVNVNAMIAYGLNEQGFHDEAMEIARRVLSALAKDLRETGEWHEDFDAENGSGISASGFFSWNTLGYRLMDDLENMRNPFALSLSSFVEKRTERV